MEDFVTFEIAQKLKKKGYPIKRKISGILGLTKQEYIDVLPTISQVLKWFRGKHATHIEISLGRNGWYFGIIQYEYYEEEKEYGCKLITISVINDSYEKAAHAGVNYCLENLI